MKKIFTKIITAYIIIASLALVLKLGDGMLAKASLSNTPDQCGTNNGIVWNGSQCVNFCDQAHPWDPAQKRCSNGYAYSGYNSTINSNHAGNCSAYGSGFFWNGSYCVQTTPLPNATYNGNPFNGGYTTPVYNHIPVNHNHNGYNDYNYVAHIPHTHTNTCNSCGHINPSPRVITTYYIYTTTTTSSPNYSSYYSNNYSKYTYLGNGYNSCSVYSYCDFSDYSYGGYYDIYGYYHF
jgi:hypothetical protein